MSTHWSPGLKDAIRKLLERVEQENGILDAYAAANKIQNDLPEENVALEDIISALLRGRGTIQAIEFAPPADRFLEVVMPAPRAKRDLTTGDDEEASMVPG